MTRESKDDLNELRKFVAHYSLKELSKLKAFDVLLAQQHGKYHALLTVGAEFRHQIHDLQRHGQPVSHLPSTIQLSYIDEALSDIGQSYFSWIHGAYKTSRVMLRSSIETFVKGVACEEEPSVLTETSLYKVFDLAKTTAFFSSKGAACFTELHAKYGVLSEDVHTARASNMSKVSSLSHFPSFKSGEASKTGNLVVYVATRQLVALCTVFNQAFHAMHHRNKETVLDSVPAAQRRPLHNLD